MQLTSFSPSALGFALLFFMVTLVFAVGVPKRPDLWKILPRERNLGEVFVVVCVIWAWHHLMPMLADGLAFLKPMAMVALPAAAVLAYFYLSFLLTRAVGCFMLLMINHLLQQAFVSDIALRPVFSTVCYLLLVVSLVAILAPWVIREVMRYAADSHLKAYGVASGPGALTLFYVCFALVA